MRFLNSKFLLLKNARGLLFALLATFSLGKMQAGIRVTSHLGAGDVPVIYYPASADDNEWGLNSTNENVKNMAAWSIMMNVLASMESNPDSQRAFALVARVAGDLAKMGTAVANGGDTVVSQLIGEALNHLTDSNKIVFEGDKVSSWLDMKRTDASFVIKEIHFFADLMAFISAENLSTIQPLFEDSAPIMPSEFPGLNVAKLHTLLLGIQQERSQQESLLQDRLRVLMLDIKQDDADLDGLTSQVETLRHELTLAQQEHEKIVQLVSAFSLNMSSGGDFEGLLTKVSETLQEIEQAKEEKKQRERDERARPGPDADSTSVDDKQDVGNAGDDAEEAMAEPHTTNEQTASTSATNIQRIFRGHLVRKQQQQLRILDALLSNEEDKLPNAMKTENEVASLKAKLEFLTRAFNNQKMLKARLEKLTGKTETPSKTPQVEASPTRRLRRLDRPTAINTSENVVEETESQQLTPTNKQGVSPSSTPRSTSTPRSHTPTSQRTPRSRRQSVSTSGRTFVVELDSGLSEPDHKYQFSFDNSGVARLDEDKVSTIQQYSGLWGYVVGTMDLDNQPAKIKLLNDDTTWLLTGDGLPLKDDLGKVLIFNTVEAAKKYLKAQGFSETSSLSSGSDIDRLERRNISEQDYSKVFDEWKSQFLKNTVNKYDTSFSSLIPTEKSHLEKFREVLINAINNQKEQQSENTFAKYNALRRNINNNYSNKLIPAVDAVNDKLNKVRLQTIKLSNNPNGQAIINSLS